MARGQALEAPMEYEIDPGLQKELLDHPGKWVAMTRSDLLAVGDDPGEVIAQAQTKGVASPILYRVPNKDTLYFF